MYIYVYVNVWIYIYLCVYMNIYMCLYVYNDEDEKMNKVLKFWQFLKGLKNF